MLSRFYPRFIVWTVFAASVFGNSVFANDELLKCRKVSESAARLACYDGIKVDVATKTDAKGDVKPATATPPTAVAGAPAAKVANPTESFGLEQRTPSNQLDKLESRIVGTFTGWGPNSWITFENGQSWQVQDDTRRMLDLKDPKVWIERGFLGAFYLVIEGTNHSPRVKRVR